MRRDWEPECAEEQVDLNKVLDMAERHKVLPILYDVLCGATQRSAAQLSSEQRRRVERESRKTVQQSYRLLFLSRYVLELLNENGVSAVLLKGAGTASFYPVPEVRKSGDVDLLVTDAAELQKGSQALEAAGFRVKEVQHAHHHVVLVSPEGIDVELHGMLAEPFDNEGINRYLAEKQKECFLESELKEVMGVELRVLKPGFHAYELLLHMLQHFLRSGFGLKLLCDWVVFWNGKVPPEEQKKFLTLVSESGLKGFADMVTAVCVRYLGLNGNRVTWMDIPGEQDIQEFMQEVLEAEEFGKSGKDRMVAMRGNSPVDYIREFHHQMHLNFPKAGRIVLVWPILWVITLVRFLRNNKKLRKVSGWSIIRKAGQRSKVIKRMHLFQN